MRDPTSPLTSDDRAGCRHLARERRIIIVTVFAAMMMVGEIAGGIAYGSMALLADGLHMVSHSAALGISVFAYAYARRFASDERFVFGTGKANALGGFCGAIILGGIAALMTVESVRRCFDPVAVAFDHAILVATLGLVVNTVSARVLDIDIEGDADHNLRSAYLHVLAAAVTSLLAILGLVAGKFLGLV